MQCKRVTILWLVQVQSVGNQKYSRNPQNREIREQTKLETSLPSIRAVQQVP